MGISRTLLAAHARHLTILLLALGAGSTGSAATITYLVNQTIGSGGVTGDIITDGTIGTLARVDILDWNLLLNDGSTTFSVLGPLSGNNSAIAFSGADLSATATQLLFNFSGADAGFVFFQSPSIGSGRDVWCLDTSNSCSGVSAGENVVTTAPPGQTSSLSGTQVIATTSSTPEPSTLALLGTGILALLGFRRPKSA